MRAPCYYCPPGIPRPAHIRSLAPNQLVEGAGPDLAGGVTYGDRYDPAERELYHLTAAGWWVRIDGLAPREILRANAIPGHDVDGWIVPQLLDGDISAVGYWTATGFVVPKRLVDLVEGLRGMLDFTGQIGQEQVNLAERILELNYHATWEEFGLLKIITRSFAWRVLCAASGAP